MAEPYIKLTRSTMTTYIQGRTQGYRFTVEASDGIDIPDEIFVYQRKPIISGSEYTDVFVNIASPADLEEYPVDEPASAEVPFFRLAGLDLVFRSITLADEAWEAIKNDVDMLIETKGYMEDLDIDEIVEYGSSSLSGE